jgi:hypothetical protein
VIVNKPRFPRIDDENELEMVRWFIKLRKKYPAPKYDRHKHGSWNPGDYLPSWAMRQTTERLRELCEKHALKSKGSRKRLIKRIYLHWRASRLRIGDVYYGYGKGYEYQRIPDCSCGFLRKDYIEGLQEKRLKIPPDKVVSED